MKRTILIVALSLALVGAIGAFLLGPRALLGQAGAPEIILYSEENFTGRVLRVTGTMLDMPLERNLDGSDFDWNDRAQSLVVVSGAWRCYEHGRLNTGLDDTPVESLDIATKEPARGWSTIVSATSKGRLEIPKLAEAGIGGGISSLELVSADNVPDWVFLLRRP